MVIEILTMTARDYCETQGRKLSDYQPHGVRLIERSDDLTGLLEKAPKGTEAITDLKERIGFPGGYIVSGTALVPKNNSS